MDQRSIEEKVLELKEITLREMQLLNVPGAALGLTIKGEETCFGYGITHIDHPNEVTPQTLFQIGSTTKTITAMLIMILSEQGKLKLDDRVRKYLPEFRVQDEYTSDNVTLRQLLNHTAGWDGNIFTDTGADDDALQEYVSQLANTPQQTSLGEVYSYNNTSFNIAGRIVEVLTGKTYEAIVREMVLEPLEMTNSFFFPDEMQQHCVAAGHHLKDNTLCAIQQGDGGRSSNPCGGLVSDVIDQMKYARFHMGNGRTCKGKRLLSEESMRAMQTPTFAAEGDKKIGLAWQLKEINTVKFVFHGGSCAGQQSDFWMAPNEGIAMTVLTNQDNGAVLHNRLSQWVQEHFLGAVEPLPKPQSLSDQDLAPYLGDYILSPTGDVFNLCAKDGSMVITHIWGDYSGLFDTIPGPYPAMHAAIFKSDRFVLLDAPFKGIQGEFMRGTDGRVVWMRLGERVLAKR